MQSLPHHINRYTNLSIISKYRQTMASVMLYSIKCTVLMYRINTVSRFNIVIKPKVTATTFLWKYTDKTVLRITYDIYFHCGIYFKITNPIFLL